MGKTKRKWKNKDYHWNVYSLWFYDDRTGTLFLKKFWRLYKVNDKKFRDSNSEVPKWYRQQHNAEFRAKNKSICNKLNKLPQNILLDDDHEILFKKFVPSAGWNWH